MQTCFRNLKKRKPLETSVCSSKSYIPQLFARFGTQKTIFRSRCRFLGESFGCHLGFCVPISQKACRSSVFVPNQEKAAVEHRFLLCKCTSMYFFFFKFENTFAYLENMLRGACVKWLLCIAYLTHVSNYGLGSVSSMCQVCVSGSSLLKFRVYYLNSWN